MLGCHVCNWLVSACPNSTSHLLTAEAPVSNNKREKMMNLPSTSKILLVTIFQEREIVIVLCYVCISEMINQVKVARNSKCPIDDCKYCYKGGNHFAIWKIFKICGLSEKNYTIYQWFLQTSSFGIGEICFQFPGGNLVLPDVSMYVCMY